MVVLLLFGYLCGLIFFIVDFVARVSTINLKVAF